MDDLRKYLNGLAPHDQATFAQRCGTTVGYLRKACSTGQRIGETIAINIDRETAGAVPCETLRPDVDWAYLRSTPQPTTTDADAMAQQLQRGLDRATNQLATDPESRTAKLVSTNRAQALAELATPQPTTEPAAAGV